uniref:Fibronectin type-III domain-containing protein n=1 Tax=Arion vulgaris TaxID=1028688 RepID=A0A0B7AZ93_9EUPU
MMARSSFALRIKLLLCLALAQSGLVHSFMFDEETKATISPLDALVFIGETLKVQCTLSEDTTDISTRDMYFNVSDNKVDYTPWTIPQEDIIFENRRILADIKIPNNCSEYITIICRTKDVNNLLISAAVFVERAIQNITNFSGVYYYDSGTITVTWNLGKTYLNPSSMSINVEWSPDKPANLGGNYCASAGNEYCSIYYTGSDIIYFRVNVSIVLGERPSEQYLVPLYETFAVSDNKFVTIDNMKTSPPKSLTVVDTSATCVNFTWEDNKYFSLDILTDEIYRVDIKMDGNEEFNVSIESAVKLNSTEIVQLCELYPDTKYILTVQVKAKNINPWSDSAIVEFTTKEDQQPWV